MNRILVIDDSELVSHLLVEGLTAQGYDVQVAQNANEGYSRALDIQPDLILLDVQLPDVTGFELLRVLKNHEILRDIPVILITGTAHSVDEKVKGFQAGADDYVLKPFAMEELLERIKTHLRKRPAPVVHSEVRKGSPASVPAERVSLAIHELARLILIQPSAVRATDIPAGFSIAYLVAMLLLCGSGLLVSSGPTPKPGTVGISILAIWCAITSVVAMAGAILGIPIQWRECGRLVSLAGMPLLLKMAGALVTSAFTTLSPFLFTASPALFWPSALNRLAPFDLFDLWSTALLAYLLMGCRKSSRRKALLIAFLVWLTALLLGLGFRRFGGGS